MAKTNRLAIGLGVSLSVVLLTSTNTYAECRVPTYRSEGNYIRSDEGVGSLYISVLKEDFTVDNIVCLTRALRKQNPTWKQVYIMMFSSHEAATTYSGQHSRLLRAVYTLNTFDSLDPSKHGEYLELTPSGIDGPEWITHIDLEATPLARCRFELHERCLLGFDLVRYPPDVLVKSGSGTVSLSATVERDGSISDVQIVGAEATNSGVKDRLIEATVNNLRSWWLEPAARQDRLQITYSYVIDPSGRTKVDGSRADPRIGEGYVELDLPRQITIKGAPQD